MTAAPAPKAPPSEGLPPELDEEFLRRVDRVGLRSKQCDPYRRDQAHRALEEEVRITAQTDVQRDRRPHREHRS